MLDMLYLYWGEYYTATQVERDKVLGAIDTALAGLAMPDRERWGTTPDAAAGQSAMMSLAGGPAPKRPPEEKPQS